MQGVEVRASDERDDGLREKMATPINRVTKVVKGGNANLGLPHRTVVGDGDGGDRGMGKDKSRKVAGSPSEGEWKKPVAR